MEGIKAWEGKPIYSRLSEDCAYAISFTYVNPWTWQSMSPRSATVSGLLLENGKEDYVFRLTINHSSGYRIHIITHRSIPSHHHPTHPRFSSPTRSRFQLPIQRHLLQHLIFIISFIHLPLPPFKHSPNPPIRD